MTTAVEREPNGEVDTSRMDKVVISALRIGPNKDCNSNCREI